MTEELPDSHRIEYKKKKELLHQLTVLKKSPAWTHLCDHIKKMNRKRKEEVLAPAYTPELVNKQNYEKGIIMGSEMFAAGVDLEIVSLTEDVATLEKKLGDTDEFDTE
jgi:hypothetical protein